MRIVCEYTSLTRATDFWFTMFQRGVRMYFPSSSSIREVIAQELKIPDDVLEREIQTIFLNGSPVDDLDTARVSDGDVLALGAAMPGLVGICMRRGSPIAGFRSGITYRESDGAHVYGERHGVTIKLFNTCIEKLAPYVFDHGFSVSPVAFASLLDKRSDFENIFSCGSPHEELVEIISQQRDEFIEIVFKSQT